MSESDRAFVGSIPELYDRYLGPILFEPYALDLARRFAGFEGALLETGCGTGRATRALAQAVGQGATITATDLNEPMLARAAELVQAPNVRWRRADAQALPFDDASFDAVVCQFGVMFLPDKAAGFSEARRVLTPRGRFVFNVWDSLASNDITRVVVEAVAALFPNDPPSFFERTPHGYHDEARIRGELAQAGFGVVEVETVALKMVAKSAAEAATGLCLGSPLRAELEARRPGGLDGVVETATEALVRVYGEGTVVGQGQALVLTATA